MSTYNVGFYEEIWKIILNLSRNTHLICSTAGSCISFVVSLTVVKQLVPPG